MPSVHNKRMFFCSGAVCGLLLQIINAYARLGVYDEKLFR